MAVVSGRLSEHSVARYRGLGSTFRGLVAGLAGVICQSDADAARWLAIGAPAARLAVGGNLKFDALPAPAPSRPAARAAAGLERDRPLLVLGSVRPGEARMLARAWGRLPEAITARWQVVVVPRHARATRELIEEAKDAHPDRSANGRGVTHAWQWDDRAGVLARYYAGADVAFVGGSLAPWGGHNPLEPAACGGDGPPLRFTGRGRAGAAGAGRDRHRPRPAGVRADPRTTARRLRGARPQRRRGAFGGVGAGGCGAPDRGTARGMEAVAGGMTRR